MNLEQVLTLLIILFKRSFFKIIFLFLNIKELKIMTTILISDLTHFLNLSETIIKYNSFEQMSCYIKHVPKLNTIRFSIYSYGVIYDITPYIILSNRIKKDTKEDDSNDVKKPSLIVPEFSFNFTKFYFIVLTISKSSKYVKIKLDYNNLKLSLFGENSDVNSYSIDELSLKIDTNFLTTFVDDLYFPNKFSIDRQLVCKEILTRNNSYTINLIITPHKCLIEDLAFNYDGDLIHDDLRVFLKKISIIDIEPIMLLKFHGYYKIFTNLDIDYIKIKVEFVDFYCEVYIPFM